MKPKIRLYVDQPVSQGQAVALSQPHAHYLFGVMRQTVGGQVAVFDGQNGEWRAEIAELGKRKGVLICLEQSAPQLDPPDVWLCFAPIKKARTDFIVEKAAEMGARRILPMQTGFTNSERIRQDRLQAHAIEAAEQCGGTYVPQVAELQKFDALLAEIGTERHIMFCDEARAGEALTLPRLPGPWAILIGPEGGFTDEERARLHALPSAHAVSLGPRILRADTAAVAAMTLWQTHLGDWS